jgi:hypothetical protein
MLREQDDENPPASCHPYNISIEDSMSIFDRAV